MNPSMDDRRILAEIERRLTRDDPELVSLMHALNDQFPQDQDDVDDRIDGSAQHSWRWKAVMACVILALAGMILTAILNSSPADDDVPRPPRSLASAASVHTRRGSPWREGDCQ